MKALTDGSLVDPGVDERDAEIESLTRENRRLQRELSDARLQVERAKEDADRAMSNLRRQLGPLYRALQMVFGELDAAGIADSPSAGSADPVRTEDAGKWDQWKTRLGPSCAKVIDALLLGGEMNVEAIKIAASMGRDTVYNCTSTMGRAGILVKNGGKFSLKRS